jgi:hypothetical protein
VSYEDLHESDAPPVSEEVHLPGPTLLPFLTAIAITLIVVGTTLGWIFSIIGAVMLIGLIIRWVGDTRRDIEQLPEDHH